MGNVDYLLIANYIAIGVLILKSLFDLWLNRYIFNHQIKNGTDDLNALEKRNIRKDRASTVAFAAMSLSIIFAIGGTMEDKISTPTHQDIYNLQQALNEYDTRLKKIENYIWPPTEGGDYGSPSPSGPWDPAGMENSLIKIKEELADLTAKGNLTEERLGILIKIVNQLTENVETYKKSMEQLKRFMAVSAG